MINQLRQAWTSLLALQNDFSVRAGAVFFGAFVSDYVWAKYMLGVANGPATVAANWASVVIILGAYLVVSYVQDKRLIIPAAIGAWIGTYLAV
jgi:hypothetical protein